MKVICDRCGSDKIANLLVFGNGKTGVISGDCVKCGERSSVTFTTIKGDPKK